MKLTCTGMKEQQMWLEVGIKLPTYDIEVMRQKTVEAPRWMHFGAGNIFRVFLGGVAEDLIEANVMETGITCVETFDEAIVEQIYHPFDNLVLSVLLGADGTKKKRVIGSLAEALTKDSQRLKEAMVNPSLQLISLTITEKGYQLTDSTGAFFPMIEHDIQNTPEQAKSAVGIITNGLYQRYVAGKYPIAVVSMDNCAHNGERLKSAVITIAGKWLEKGNVAADFVSYLKNEQLVSFPWTMIDKITPRPSQMIANELTEMGIEQMMPITTDKGTFIAPFVNAEVPQYLVIEDVFPNGRPAFKKIQAGVYLADRETVNRVERMKVTTCLNPLHTALAVYGCLLGYTRISEEMKDEQLKKLVTQIGAVEGMKVVTDPVIFSANDFLEEVLNERLPNPYVPDTPQRIATDTSQKMAIRFGETIKGYLKQGEDVSQLTGIALAIAGWLRYLLAVDDKGEPFELANDPMKERLCHQLKGIVVGQAESYTGQLKNILNDTQIFGVDLTTLPLGERIEGLFIELMAGVGSVRQTLTNHL